MDKVSLITRRPVILGVTTIALLAGTTKSLPAAKIEQSELDLILKQWIYCLYQKNDFGVLNADFYEKKFLEHITLQRAVEKQILV